MAQLHVKDSPVASNNLNEQAKSNIKRAGLKLDEDQTQVSSSSTKAPSLDGKSTTSGTTFAFDEKESLRPDDSASVQAVDDDDIASGPMSGAPSSRIGSEAGNRAFRDQFNEISASSAAVHPRSHPLSQGITSDAKDEGLQINTLPTVPAVVAQSVPQQEVSLPARPPITHEYREPDEKLFEALDSPKDRMFLLRLEQEIINFVKNSSPTPIALLVKGLATEPNPNTVPPATLPAMKIMRRPGLHNKDGQIQSSGPGTTESSVVPSKAGSETGDDSQHGTGAVSPTESTLARDKAALSRAEREARYKEKREQIFGPQNEDDEGNEKVNELSRTSSRNEEKKRKKKHRNNNDDFEARSQFNAYYPTMQYTVHPYAAGGGGSPALFTPYTTPLQAPQATQPNCFPTTMAPQGYQQAFQTAMPTQAIPVMVPQNGIQNVFNSQSPMQGFEQPPQTQYFAVMQGPMMMSPQPSSISSPSIDGGVFFSQPQPQPQPQMHMQMQMNDPQSPRNGYNQPYTPQIHQQQQFNTQPTPYQFGQLPYQPSMQTGKLAHPLPGSYNRQQQTFNPQIRSFVPNAPASSARTPPHTGNAVPHSIRGSANPIPNGNHFSQTPSQHGPSPNQKDNQLQQSSEARKPVVHTNGTNSPAPSTLSKWSTPANLPRKPPPPEAPSMPDSLPVNNQFTPNIQPITAGQPMPHYQNGIYSLPNTGTQ
ncbi:uncharacterized protein KY384_006982 [Bacidia gigantensis]|uniref:uncharacterized protein n=1 Tax=Bacidia gigantensis TaxID=2732470 RepID=UPI001D03C235|nr:uncharacterized protein KY384_006982 [Bacidia gigantensis]KAG8528066.1 hypothetical protein KY384_006982 [Bacidia gigantensis]